MHFRSKKIVRAGLLLGVVLGGYFFLSVSIFFAQRHAAYPISIQIHGISSDLVSIDAFSIRNQTRYSFCDNGNGSLGRGAGYISGFEMKVSEDDFEKIEAGNVCIGPTSYLIPSARFGEYFTIKRNRGSVRLRSTDRFAGKASAVPVLSQCITWKGDAQVVGQALQRYFPVLIYNILLVFIFLGIPLWRVSQKRNPLSRSIWGEARFPGGYALALVLLTVLCGVLFACQSLPGERYPSDMRSHVESIGTGYSFLHLFLGTLQRVFEATLECPSSSLPSLLMAGVLTLSVLMVSISLNIYFRKRHADSSPRLANFMSIALMLVSMGIFNPWNVGRLYAGISTPNVWHNPTFLFCRLFSLGVFVLMTGLLESRVDQKPRIRTYVLLSALSFFSMWAKPSFLMSFLPASALIVVIQLFRHRMSLQAAVLTGMAFLLSLLPLWLIYTRVYVSPESSGGIVFAFNAAQSNLALFFPGLVLSSAFPLYVVWRRIRGRNLSVVLSLAFANYLVAIFIRFFVAETGERMTHGNFGWSYSLALFFLFFAAAEDFFFTRKEREEKSRVFGNFLFFWHLISGLYYFGVLLLGYSYS